MNRIWEIADDLEANPLAYGRKVIVLRPRDVCCLPKLELVRDPKEGMGHIMRQVEGKIAWYEWAGGPQITSILAESDEDTSFSGRFGDPLAQLHILTNGDGEIAALGKLDRVEEYAAVFDVHQTAPVEIIKDFMSFFEKIGAAEENSKLWIKRAIGAAYSLHQGHTIPFAHRVSGANWYISFAPDAEPLTVTMYEALELIDKLPSGSGFNNGWHLTMHEQYHLAETTYEIENTDENDEEGYGETRRIDISYSLHRDAVDGEWSIKDLNENDDDPYEDYDYCYQAVAGGLSA